MPSRLEHSDYRPLQIQNHRAERNLETTFPRNRLQQNTLRADKKNPNRGNLKPTKRHLDAERIPTAEHDSDAARKRNERSIQERGEASKVKPKAKDATRYLNQGVGETSHANQSNDEGKRKDVE